MLLVRDEFLVFDFDGTITIIMFRMLVDLKAEEERPRLGLRVILRAHTHIHCRFLCGYVEDIAKLSRPGNLIVCVESA